MNLRNLGARMARRHARLAKRKMLNAGDVLLRWRERTGVPVDYDRHLACSAETMQIEDKSDTVQAFIHYVDIHTTGYTRFAQVQAGDVILDFPADVVIDGKEDLRFEIGGEIYVQKNGGNELAKSWDVRCGGVPVVRTVLVTKMS
jgi:hypothetical protein